MDVHRARFIPYPTSAVSAVAFSRSGDDGPSGADSAQQPALKLAIGRVNGDVEIWNPNNGSWVQESAFGGDNKSVDALVWTREPDDKDYDGNPILGQHRLFSITASPAVTEWDLETGREKRQSTGNFSEAWCLAAQPRTSAGRDRGPQQTHAQDLVAGCEDGSLVLLSTAENDLQYKRTLARTAGKKARCMSVAYQTHDRVVAGFADSTVRIYDTRKGVSIRSLSLGAGIPGAPKDVLVWKVKCLPNGDIVSGDSNGEVKIWDGRSYSLKQRLKGHDSDCVEIVTSSDGHTVFSGSLDGRIAVYRQTKNPVGRQAWARDQQRRLHNGDLKSMAAFEDQDLSVVVSGGSDMTPIITPMRGFGKERNRFLPALPQSPPVVCARQARLLVSWWDRSIWIWRIFRQSTAVDLVPVAQGPRKLVAKIDVDVREKIRDVSISFDGRALAVSTNTQVKMFQLRRRLDHESLAIRKLVPPPSISRSGARLITFSPNGKWLSIVTPENDVQIVRLSVDPSNPKHLHVLDNVVELERVNRKAAQPSALQSYDRTINQLAFAPDSSVLAVSDISGYIDTWVLEGNEDPTAAAVEVDNRSNKPSADDDDESMDSSDEEDTTTIFYGQHWADSPAGHLLPQLDSAALVLSFRPPRPMAAAATPAVANGNPGIHPTRHHPHAHSHALPSGPHRLWAMTAAHHQMYEFDVLAGRLSAWGRAHATTTTTTTTTNPHLPSDFTKLSDRVMGAVWDVTAGRERLWLYGSSWLFMLDLRLDGSVDSTPKKRRASVLSLPPPPPPASSSKSGSSGAVATPKARKTREHATAADARRLSLAGAGDDDGGVDAPEPLLDTGPAPRLQASRLSRPDDEAAGPSPHGDRKWWLTFKYRPILGVVALASSDGRGGAEARGDGAGLDDNDDDDDDAALEVVIVERPLWST